MTFRMQCWSSRDGVWSSMDEGTAPKVWKPRRTREEAVHKCIEWTGGLMIPAMRVVDLDSGDVIWQDTREYPAAGETILPDWTAVLYEQVRADCRRTYLASLCECGKPSGTVACRANHSDGIPPRRGAAPSVPADDGALFSLTEVAR